VLILEVDAERRRLSLSLKRVEEGTEPLPRADGAESVHMTPKLDLSEDVFPAGAAVEEAEEVEEAAQTVETEEVAEAGVDPTATDTQVEELLAAADEPAPRIGRHRYRRPLVIAAAVAAAVAELEALGAHVEAVDPGFDDPLDITTGLWFAGAHAIWAGLTPAQQERVDPDFRAEAELGAAYGALDLHRLALRRGALGAHMRQFMQRWDLLATPAVAVPAFDARPAGHSPMDPATMLGWTPFSYPFNLTQQPACTIPCGLTGDGLPIGLQLVGPMFGDALVLRAARAYESARPIARPKLDGLRR
jgi:Asp-tRNA(Asn)/Glu-tRNA(Gln) amidotransferase A subunit family amidase